MSPENQFLIRIALFPAIRLGCCTQSALRTSSDGIRAARNSEVRVCQMLSLRLDDCDLDPEVFLTPHRQGVKLVWAVKDQPTGL